MDDETFDEQELSDLKAALHGTEYKKLQAKNAVTDVPEGFKEWVAENEGKQADWRSTPYFIRDNFRNGNLADGLKFYTFAEISIKDLDLTDKVEYLRQARAKYDAYDTQFWTKEYFDEISGGYTVYHKKHVFSKTGGGGDAEKTVGRLLADYNGKQVEFLPEGWKKQADIMFDGKTWDIKFIEHANEQTIRNHIKDARKADNVIFYFTDESKLEVFSNSAGREVGRFLKGQTRALPDIYYIDKDGLLKLLWEKPKGAK